jgi:extracellular solute-binding protein
MKRESHPARTAWLVLAGLVVFMLVLAGCGGGGDDSGDSSGDGGETLQKLGKGEGQVNLISWAGYVEPGWSKPFEAKTGCKVNNKVAGTSDEMVKLMESGQYDGVSASGNATARLVAADEVSPVNVDLVPNYKTVFADLKDQPYNTFDGQPYGIPHGRGANLLMWNGDDVSPAPTSWDVMLDPKMAAKYSGKISVYDDPIYIADAAVYLKTHEPDLGIERRAVRSGGRPAEGTGPERRRILVGSRKTDLGLLQRRRHGGHHLAVPVLRPAGRKRAGGGEPREPGIPAERGCDGLVRHLDDQQPGQASQLHVRVDELDHRTESQRRSGGMVR